MPKKYQPLSTGAEWSHDLIDCYYEHIERIAKEKFKLDIYPNQLEIIFSEQMVEAYSSHAMPIYYEHWSAGLQFVKEMNLYKKGRMGLAYEVVINSNPCIAYLMSENTMLMQILVTAHACFGHNHFFKNNYMFQQWTDADDIIDYLVYAKKYIRECEFSEDPAEVEAVIDACHTLQHHGLDKYKRPSKLTATQIKAEKEDRDRWIQQQVNVLWSTIPKTKGENRSEDDEGHFPKTPQENILKFIEEHAPNLPDWKREIIRIIRTLSQYFYPQMSTKLMNEGFACVTGDTLIDTPNGLLTAKRIVEQKYNDHVDDGITSQKVVNWFNKTIKDRICIKLKNGFKIHGGIDHKISINGKWVELKDIQIGDKIPIIKGKNIWPKNEITLPDPKYIYRHSIGEICGEYEISTTTLWRYRNIPTVVSENASIKCKLIEENLQEDKHLITKRNIDTRKDIKIPKTLNKELSYFLGLLIGNGNIHHSSSGFICLTSGDEEIKDWAEKTLESLVGVKPSIKKDENRWRIILRSNNLVDYFIENFNFKFGKASHIKEVPEMILESPEEIVSSFLQGHLDADGCCEKRQGNVILISNSKKLIEVEQQIFLKFGIISSVSYQKDGCYRLVITGTDTKTFKEKIGFRLRRKQIVLEEKISNKKFFIEKKLASEVTKITHDKGEVYDFSVENTNQYKASCFINHNCFIHYHILQEMYDEGLIDDGYMLEFLTTHTNVTAQPEYDDDYYSGINVYALGFAMYQDIKRVSIEPTEEDLNWFYGKEWPGNGKWLENILFAAANFKDESFVTEYLSPKVIRDFKLFSVIDDDRDSELEVSAIHNDQGYKRIREVLSNKYNIGYMIPEIQVAKNGVDIWGNRSLKLQHIMRNRVPLDEESTTEVLKHIRTLWGYNVTMESIDESGKKQAIYEVTDKENLLNVFLDDDS